MNNERELEALGVIEAELQNSRHRIYENEIITIRAALSRGEEDGWQDKTK